MGLTNIERRALSGAASNLNDGTLHFSEASPARTVGASALCWSFVLLNEVERRHKLG